VSEPLARFQDTLVFPDSVNHPKQFWIDEWVRNNHRLKSLARQGESARSELKQAKAEYLPSLSLQLRAQESNIGFENSSSPKNESLVASLNLKVPLYSGGTTRARNREKQAALLESKARYEEERRGTVKQIREAYLNIKANAANIAASKKAISSAEKSYEASEKGFKYGTVTVVDVLDAKSEVLRYSNEYRQKQYDYAINLMNLLRLSGRFSADSMILANGWLVEE
jgi:outer membrane protein